MSKGQKVLKAIKKVKQHITPRAGESDYDFSKRIQNALQVEIGLRVLVLIDIRSTDAFPRLNIAVWSEKGRQIRNPDLKGTNRINYFYA